MWSVTQENKLEHPEPHFCPNTISLHIHNKENQIGWMSAPSRGKPRVLLGCFLSLTAQDSWFSSVMFIYVWMCLERRGWSSQKTVIYERVLQVCPIANIWTEPQSLYRKHAHTHLCTHLIMQMVLLQRPAFWMSFGKREYMANNWQWGLRRLCRKSCWVEIK